MSLGLGRAARQHRLPPGQRIYAIGDVHGRLDLLDDLLRQIEACDAARDGESQLVFLGDLVDRGPDSKGVVARAMELQRAGRVVAFLMGNHEEVMLRAAEGDRKAALLFTRIGGRETLLSYGVDEDSYRQAEIEEIGPLILRHVPREHLAFLESFEDSHSVGDYLFVHAGIRPDVPLKEQQSRDLRWIRGEFLEFRGDHDALVVHGHSITQTVDERPNRIGIDTGAYATGVLTAIGIDGDRRWFLSTNK